MFDDVEDIPSGTNLTLIIFLLFDHKNNSIVQRWKFLKVVIYITIYSYNKY